MPVTVPALNCTVSSPEPRNTSPTIFGVVVVEAAGFWIRVTPVVLWLRSMATVLPVAVSVSTVGVTEAVIAPVLVTAVRLPDRSTSAVELPRSPIVPALIVPELVMALRWAPDSIRMPVACDARAVVAPALTTPSLTRIGVFRPERTWMAVEPAW